VDTGEDTMTGGRLKRVARYVQDEEAFASLMAMVCLTSILLPQSRFTKSRQARNRHGGYHRGATVRWSVMAIRSPVLRKTSR
jgi:hypothetical protein